MKRSLMFSALLLALIMMLAACGGATQPAAPAPPPAAPPAELVPADEVLAAEPAPTDQGTPDRPFRIGATLQTLQNPSWAAVFGHVERLLDQRGIEHTILDSDNNSAVQISQIENFITSGVDLIYIHAADSIALEDVARQAREAGIIVMAWDDIMENSDLNMVLDNRVKGYAIGEAAAHHINEHFSTDNPVQVAVMNYPAVPILLEREQGIIEALEAHASGLFEIVASQPALDAAVAMSHVETILQAHPNVRVVVSIGAGGAVGANEAFMVAHGGNVPADIGVFSADITLQQLESVLNNEANRVLIGAEGSSLRTGEATVNVMERLLAGENLPRNLLRTLAPADINNAADFLADYDGL